MDTVKFSSAYSESALWDKIAKFASKAGRELITNVLKLYYAIAFGKATPEQIAAIIAALGYFISPVDAVLDVLPGGYFDDAGVITLAVRMLTCCNDSEVVRAAKKKASEWFD
jgi:uncharacterized membrane protein YkvA (DUF1232 family)